jgi:nucleotide-binding universal stress UspA family protein
MLKKIAVAMDGSEHSERAFDFACDLAAKFGAELKLVHVVTERDVPDDLRRMAEIEHLIPNRYKSAVSEAGANEEFGSVMKNVEKSGEAYQILEKLGENLLTSGVADARAKGVEKVSSALLRGDPADELIRYIKTEKVDTVISGSRGLGKLRGMLVGSVSQKLTQHAPCASVLVR